MIAAIVGAILGLVMALRHIPEYTAELTFMLNEDETGSLGGFSALLGQFGFGLGSQESNLDKILELSRTRKIAKEALLTDSVTIHGRSDYLANHIIDNMDSLGKWSQGGFLSFGKKDKLTLKGFHFKQNNVEAFTTLENKALKKVHTLLVGDDDVKPILYCSYSDITGIMTMNATTTEEALSIALVKSIFDNLSAYYIEKAVEKQKYDYEIIREKYDSINTRLNTVQYELAAFEDKNKGLYKKQDRLVESRLSLEIQKLSLMLAEAEKNLQLADYTLKNKTPYIQLIDAPIAPIVPATRPALQWIILGAVLGVLLLSMLIVLRKAFREIMQ